VINPCHCNHTLAVTVLLLLDKPQGLRSDNHDPNRAWRRFQQGRPCRYPHHKDEVIGLHRVGTFTPLYTEDTLQTYTCKSPATPCDYKRGGRAPHWGHGQHTNTQLATHYRIPLHKHRVRGLRTLSTPPLAS